MDNSPEQKETTDNPMEQALRNPIILEKIFQNYSIDGSKWQDVRLVCKLWNEIVISLPKLKFCVDLLYEDLQWSDCFEDDYLLLSRDMEPKLATTIKLDQNKCSSNPAKSLLLHVSSSQFSDYMKYLELVHIEDSLVLTLYNILLQRNNCPNLQGISISDRDKNPTLSTLGADVQPLPRRTKLLSIYLRMHQLSTTTSICILGQLLINSAPNLRRLELSSHQYFPDLSKCFNLVALLFPIGPNLRLVKCEPFSRMLKQVADRLEVLLIGGKDSMYPQIEWSYYKEKETVKLDFEMPKMMPRLKTFRNEYIDVFKCGNALEDIYGKRCPRLQHLILGCYNNTGDLPYWIRMFDDDVSNFNFGGVTSLNLESFNYHKTSFPHLKKLEILSRFGDLKLGPLFKACSSSGLTHLDATVEDYPETLSEFVDSFLNNAKLFKRLKFLYLNRANIYSLEGLDDLKANPDGMNLMKKFVLTFAGMQKVVISYPICEKAWNRIMPFISENNVPLEFEGHWL